MAFSNKGKTIGYSHSIKLEGMTLHYFVCPDGVYGYREYLDNGVAGLFTEVSAQDFKESMKFARGQKNDF